MSSLPRYNKVSLKPMVKKLQKFYVGDVIKNWENLANLRPKYGNVWDVWELRQTWVNIMQLLMIF